MLRTGEICEQDLAQIAELEQEIFSDAWSIRGVTDTFRQSGAVIFGVWEEEELAGYAVLYFVLDEGEIPRIAVKESFRRRGAAGMLFQKIRSFCVEKGIRNLFLEVRESNAPALTFYRKCGFKESGIRKNFYTNPSEDAILMEYVTVQTS